MFARQTASDFQVISVDVQANFVVWGRALAAETF